MNDDPTNAARQARLRKMRAEGLEYVSGWLPPERAAEVRQWLDEAKAEPTPAQPQHKPR
jgi:anti-sigma factor RsiW